MAMVRNMNEWKWKDTSVAMKRYFSKGAWKYWFFKIWQHAINFSKATIDCIFATFWNFEKWTLSIDWHKDAIDCISSRMVFYIFLKGCNRLMKRCNRLHQCKFWNFYYLLFWEIYQFNFYQISLASLSKVNKIFSWIFMHEKIFLSTKIIKVKIFIYLSMNLTRDLFPFFCNDHLLLNLSSPKLIFGEAWLHINCNHSY